jgi:hypothetical protein
MLSLLYLMQCANAPTGPGDDFAGSVSESPNAITGTVITAQNSDFIETSNAAVILFEITESLDKTGSVDYSWTQLKTVTTDTNGKFTIDSMEAGDYTLLFQKDDKKAFSGYFRYEKEDSTVTLVALLENTITIKGQISDTASASSKEFYLGLVGTPYFDTASATDSFCFANIPSAEYKWRIQDSTIETSFRTVLFADTLTVASAPSSFNLITAGNYYIDTLAREDTAYLDTSNNVPVFPWFGWSVDAADVVMEPTENKVQMTQDNYLIEYTITEN